VNAQRVEQAGAVLGDPRIVVGARMGQVDPTVGAE
jgi:hypothetical protein